MKRIHHYIFLGRERERLPSLTACWKLPAVDGAQIAYPWRLLEPEKDAYDFRALKEDIATLRTYQKHLFLQLQDVTFSAEWRGIPRYLQQDPRYHGGANQQYDYTQGQEDKAVVAGWVARRWDPAVQERLHRLFQALGKAFDGQITGINLAETSVEFGDSGRLFPPNFTPLVYRDAIIANMSALKRAFPRSATLQYANFMPGEWLPDSDKGHLRAVYQAAKRLRVGVGGPDLLPYKPEQMQHSYPLIHSVASTVLVGVAVQDGNFAHIHPNTKKRVTLAEMLTFAREYLQADYLFWGTEEPYFSKQVLPFLQSAG
jgi:hypothetical protein